MRLIKSIDLEDFFPPIIEYTHELDRLLDQMKAAEINFLSNLEGENIRIYSGFSTNKRRFIVMGNRLSVDRYRVARLKDCRKALLDYYAEEAEVIEGQVQELGQRSAAMPVIVMPGEDHDLDSRDLRTMTRLSKDFGGAVDVSLSTTNAWRSKRFKTDSFVDQFAAQIERAYTDPVTGEVTNEAAYDSERELMYRFANLLIDNKITNFSIRQQSGSKVTTFVKFMGWTRRSHTHHTISIIPTSPDLAGLRRVPIREKKATRWVAGRLKNLFGEGDITFDIHEAQAASERGGFGPIMLSDDEPLALPPS